MIEDNQLNAPLLSQRLTLRAYTAFALQAGDDAMLCGKLLVLSGLGRQGIACAFGGTLAGAACLGIDPDPQTVKQAMREGGCDFMVTTLDEALRILKTEIRKRRPVSVGMAGAAAEVMQELVERGVQPDLLTDFLLPPAADVPDSSEEDADDSAAVQVAAMQKLAARGATLLDMNGRLAGWFSAPVVPTPGQIEVWSKQQGYELWQRAMGSGEALRAFDAAALALMPQEDWLRRRWLEQGPKYFRRHLPERWLWVTAEEKGRLL